MVLMVFYLLMILHIFVGVIFITLFERKVLGLIQFRLGPNKISLKGSIQSLSDALKLMTKADFLMMFSSQMEYNFLPMGMFILMMIVWTIIPNKLFDYNNSLLMVICVLSAGVYPIMFGSWFSGSLYSMFGSIRAIAQMISYEVSMIIIIISLVIFPKSFNLIDFFEWGVLKVFMLFPMIGWMLMFSFLVELGRSPVDLLEGESELVSGFNTEYSGLKFALVFLSEYGMIMFMGGLMGCLYMGIPFFSVEWSFSSIFFIMIILWIRSIVPRIRYDKLMTLCWVGMLNLSLGILICNMGFILII